jgi:hypothetical protein
LDEDSVLTLLMAPNYQNVLRLSGEVDRVQQSRAAINRTRGHMTMSRNAIILALSVAVVTLGYFYYQSRQSVIEIKMPSVTIGKQP